MTEKILILTPFFSPNIGGVESHLDDLVAELNRRKISSYVLTYSALTTKTSFLSNETRNYCQIKRFHWFGHQLFPKVEKYPLLDFLYLTPYLLFRSFFWLLFNKNKISIIHSQGFNAAFIGNILAKIFHLKHLCSTHAIYENINGLSRFLTIKVLSNCDKILCLSNASVQQLTKWGIDSHKVSLYRYWINLKNFSPRKISSSKPIFLFVGRLISKKGISIYLKLASKYPQFRFNIAGTGPMEEQVKYSAQKYQNIHYFGALANSDLPNIYRQSSILCMTTQYPEGYGRVLMESVACGLPVIGSNLGAIPEALDDSVSILFKPTINNFVKNINLIVKKPDVYKSLQKKCRSYAIKNFSIKNFETIFKTYQSLLNTN